MTAWSQQRRRPSRARRNTVVLVVILAMILTVVPSARTGAGVARTAAAAPPTGPVNVPEHPEGTQFNPNQLKDIRAADPATAVNLIDAPTANNLGDAQL